LLACVHHSSFLLFDIVKRLLFILLPGLLSGLNCFAQQDTFFVWNKWCARKDTLLLFVGSYNVIEVYSPRLKPGDYYLKSMDKTLKVSGEEVSGDTLTMLAMPYTSEKPMRLAIMSKSSSKPIKVLQFAGDVVPVPKVRLGKLKDYEVPKVNVLAQVGLNVYFPNSLYNYPYHVTAFGLKTRYDKADVKLNAKGHLLNRDMEQAITKTPEGSVILFTDIKATCPECVTRPLDDLPIKLK
jgi:hypothetical protein